MFGFSPPTINTWRVYWPVFEKQSTKNARPVLGSDLIRDDHRLHDKMSDARERVLIQVQKDGAWRGEGNRTRNKYGPCLVKVFQSQHSKDLTKPNPVAYYHVWWCGEAPASCGKTAKPREVCPNGQSPPQRPPQTWSNELAPSSAFPGPSPQSARSARRTTENKPQEFVSTAITGYSPNSLTPTQWSAQTSWVFLSAALFFFFKLVRGVEVMLARDIWDRDDFLTRWRRTPGLSSNLWPVETQGFQVEWLPEAGEKV